MNTRFKFVLPMLMLLAGILPACSPRMRFYAPKIEPPDDLIPAYVPAGFELISGFQLPSRLPFRQPLLEMNFSILLE